MMIGSGAKLGAAVIVRSCAVLALSMLLSGCDALVDNIAPRAATYNAESHNAQMSGVLLNVVRASQRHPLEFTAIVNATGGAQANASVGLGVSSVGLTVPFAVDAVRVTSTNVGASGLALGSIQCRALLLGNPAAAGCQPLNVLGTDVASQAALLYVNPGQDSSSGILDQETIVMNQSVTGIVTL